MMHKFLDTTLAFEARADDLLSRLTLEEKAAQMQHRAPAIERLGIPAYNWWNECLHGVGRAGIATVFPQAIGLAATWDVPLMSRIATAISDEARAKHHDALRHGVHAQYLGLTYWSPNINIFRDPRWGRGQETYGECPFLTARMGVAFVKGLQGDDPRYLKLVATPKHYAVHSGPEPDRHHFDAIASAEDMRETYLPAFEACMREAGAYSIMGAYNRTNGEPCCASPTLLQDILRDEWGFAGYVVSDCGAIHDIYAHHQVVGTAEEAAALAVNAGCDLNCGAVYPALVAAVQQGLIDEATIDRSLRRLLLARFKLGMFDPPDAVSYAQIPLEVVDSPEHQALALQAARESIVLLKNEGGLLPLDTTIKSIAVIGPTADSLPVLLGNYEGTPAAPVTLLEGLRRALPQTTLYHAPGCVLVDGWLHEEAVPSAWLRPLAGDGPGLTGTYYPDGDFESAPLFTRIDPSIDFHWHRDADLPVPWGTRLGVRWEGHLTVPESGAYRLAIVGPPGYRLDLDGTTLLQHDIMWGGREETALLHLEAGHPYALHVECVAPTAPGSEMRLLIARPAAIADALDTARQADVVIMTLGITPELEGEEMPVDMPGFHGGDRTQIGLPAAQQALLERIHALGKPVVLVLTGGSALAIPWAAAHIPAILQVWYPGQAGGTALAEVLLGDYNPAGRLPVTIYASLEDLPPFEDYAMEGRTYRYFRGQALYPFGHGLSYTSFTYDDLLVAGQTVSVVVTNSGDRAGDEVVQCYLTRENDRAIRTLVGFQRVHLAPGESQTVQFQVAGAGQITVGGRQPLNQQDRGVRRAKTLGHPRRPPVV